MANKIAVQFRVDKWLSAVMMLGVFLICSALPTTSMADWYPKCNQRDIYPDYCCWTGIAPVCTAGCPSGYTLERKSKNADGALSRCWTGTHKLCCPGNIIGEVDGFELFPSALMSKRQPDSLLKSFIQE